MSQSFDIIHIRRLLQLFAMLLLTSCAFFSQEIGEKPHTFNQRPTKIIVFQVPGLSVNHFTMSKLAGSIIEQPIPLESAVCTGRLWNYSLFDVSPTPIENMEVELSGDRNSKKSCEQKSFIWKDLLKYGFTSGLYLRDAHGSTKDQASLGCYADNPNDLVVWKSIPGKSSAAAKDLKFHFLERNKKYFLNTTYFDKSCDKKKCHSDFQKTAQTIYEDFFKQRDFHFLAVQDYTYASYLKRGDFFAAKEYLHSIQSTLNYFRSLKRDDLLLVFIFSNPIELMFPPTGKEWKRIFDRVKVNPAKMHSEILAWGASSEKFCGIYHADNLKDRILRAVSDK